MTTNKPGKERKFWKVLIFTIITFGIYFLYWLYKNLTELEQAFEFDKNEKQVILAKRFYAAGFFISLLYVISLTNIVVEHPQNIRIIFIYSFYYNLFFTAVGLFLFFYFIRSIFLCQSKLNLSPFNKKAIYSLYIIRFVFDLIIAVLFFTFDLEEFIRNLFANNGIISLKYLINNENIRLLMILGMLSNAGTVIIMIFVYRLQIEINAIWKFYNSFE